jgi:hypothetical protein
MVALFKRVVGGLRLFAVAAVAMGSSQTAHAYTIASYLSYDTNSFVLSGYSSTEKDYFDEDTGEFYDPSCECWFYYEDWVNVSSYLHLPSGAVWSSAYTRGWNVANLPGSTQRPPAEGQWWIGGIHQIEEDIYDEDGVYTCPWCYWYTDYLDLGTTRWDANVPCTIPTFEGTAWNGWNDADSRPTQGRWNQTLYPSSVSFAGRTVTEQDPTGGQDTCWFLGSPYEKADHITGGTWSVRSDNTWGDDVVGWWPERVSYYQTERTLNGLPLPCSSSFPQRMVISCSDGSWPAYQRNENLGGTIDVNTVSSSRAGASQPRPWP